MEWISLAGFCVWDDLDAEGVARLKFQPQNREKKKDKENTQHPLVNFKRRKSHDLRLK
jgi:hypothetical protein